MDRLPEVADLQPPLLPGGARGEDPERAEFPWRIVVWWRVA